jgi:hypothetical protein
MAIDEDSDAREQGAVESSHGWGERSAERVPSGTKVCSVNQFLSSFFSRL